MRCFIEELDSEIVVHVGRMSRYGYATCIFNWFPSDSLDSFLQSTSPGAQGCERERAPKHILEETANSMNMTHEDATRITPNTLNSFATEFPSPQIMLGNIDLVSATRLRLESSKSPIMEALVFSAFAGWCVAHFRLEI